MKPAAGTLDNRIRECAYHLWEASGRPTGRDVEFWQRACETVAADQDHQPKPGVQGGKPEQAKSARPTRKRTRQTSRPASQAASISPG